MATLTALVSQLPYRIQRRYSGSDGSTFVNWANDGLEELEQDGHLPDFNREAGVIVENDQWITPPSDFRRGLELYNPQEPDVNYSFNETMGDTEDLKLRLTQRLTFDKEETPQAITVFSAQAIDSITINVNNIDANGYENWLLKITAGTIAPKTYRIAKNDASAGGTTKLYFLNTLRTALTPAQATTGQVIDKRYYLVLKYIGKFTRITSISEEIPLISQYESSLKAYLNWKAYEWIRVLTNETQYWQDKWMGEKRKFSREKNRVGRNRSIRGRRLAGFEQNAKNKYSFTHDSSTFT